MTRIRSAPLFVCLSYGLAPFLGQTSAFGSDLVLDSTTTVPFSALDGSPDDEDGVVDGILTLSSLTVTGSSRIVVDVSDAAFNVAGGVMLDGDGAIGPDPNALPVTGPTITIVSGGSFLMAGTSALLADGIEAGGTILVCAAGDIDIGGRAAAIASSASNPNGVGGSVILQAGGRLRVSSGRASVRANGGSGGQVVLLSCADDLEIVENPEEDAGLAVLIRGRVQAIGSETSGGSVDVTARQGGIDFQNTRTKIDARGSTEDGTVTLTSATTVTPDPPPTSPPAVVVVDSPSGESCACSLLGPISVTIFSPENRSVTAEATADVTGRVSGADSVTVNGVAASIVARTFAALNVPLAEGTNVLVATARNEAGNTASDTVSVRRDTSPPLVVIETPRDGDRLVSATITVAGTVNDIIPGSTVNSDDVTVTVNGISAPVNNRTFILPDLPLDLGVNTIIAIAVDRVGNSNMTSIQVTHEPDLAGIQIVITGGNAQRGPINTAAALPLSVLLQAADGTPFADRPVEFVVSRGDGLLNDAVDNLRMVTLLTDAGGNASVNFNLGSRTGEGFHRVRVTTPGSLTFAEFCATAEPEVPFDISIGAMPPIRGPVGQTLPNPLAVILTDEGGNPVPNAAVLFQVGFGGGNFDGQSSVINNTNLDGVAEAFLTLGPDAGENIATADFAGNLGFPATFIVSGIVTGPVEDTRVSAVVLDNAGDPIAGVLAVIRNTNLEAFTGPDGKFTILDVPPGGHHVGILGSTANDPTNGIFFPDIDFAIEALAGVDNMLDPPVVTLPFLDDDGAQFVGGDEDVILTMQDVPGFAIKVFANSTFTRDPETGELVPAPDILMSSSQVKLDKLPMPPPQGSTPLIVGTLQPPGITFDPPAQVTYPNVEGLAPGDVADIFAFHHDIGQFVNIGPGTVSEDGSVVVSDPGFGIVQSGWHCLIRIPGPKANCANKCTASIEWQLLKADGTPNGPIKTKGPVVISCVDGDATKAKITVKFSPGGGSFDSQNWSGGSPQVTRSGESASGTTAMVTVEATNNGGTATVTSPIYRILVDGQADKTCQAAVEVEVAGIEFLNDAMDKTAFANVANWETGFDPGPSARQNFHETDADRFFVQITDPARQGTGGAIATITATMRTIDSASATADTVENFTLTETASGSGVFKSGPCVLVSNRVDDAFQANGVADGNAADPTLNIFVRGKMTSAPLSIQVGGTVRVDYNASTGMGPIGGADGECHAQIDVCEPRTIKTVTLRPFILRRTAGGAAVTTDTKVKEDFALMNVAWAQCCIRLVGGSNIQTVDPPPSEPFMDVGFDHDNNPGTPNINPTAGFDFVDNNANNLHDSGEPSEPFTDSNGNGGYDFGVNLADGSLDEFRTSAPFSLIPTREERSLIDSLADNDADTIEYFVVNTLSSGSFGEAFIPSIMQQADNLLVTNVAIFPSSTPGNRFITSAHEVGHVLLNDGGHTDRTTTAGRVNVMVGGGTDAADGVNNSKRLTNAQCTTARGF